MLVVGRIDVCHVYRGDFPGGGDCVCVSLRDYGAAVVSAENRKRKRDSSQNAGERVFPVAAEFPDSGAAVFVESLEDSAGVRVDRSLGKKRCYEKGLQIRGELGNALPHAVDVAGVVRSVETSFAGGNSVHIPRGVIFGDEAGEFSFEAGAVFGKKRERHLLCLCFKLGVGLFQKGDVQILFVRQIAGADYAGVIFHIIGILRGRKSFHHAGDHT